MFSLPKANRALSPDRNTPIDSKGICQNSDFPDNWLFAGTISNKYKQIGNAVPVNLAWAVGRSLIRLFNDIQAIEQTVTQDCSEAVEQIIKQLKESNIQKKSDIKTKELKKNDTKIKQLNFDLLVDYPNGIISNMVKEPQPKEYSKPYKIDINKNVLICLVKKDNTSKYIAKNATSYYTGKRFPSTVALDKLCYFIPYISGKGIRDIYRIKAVRVGTRKEGQIDNNPNDYRLVFDIEYIKSLVTEYKQPVLEIWHTYTSMTLGELISAI